MEKIKALPPLQLAILESAAQAVRPGGVLVYSTCTIEQAENQDVVRAFLADHAEFRLEQTGSFLPPLPQAARHAQDDMVQLYPQVDGTDGFFIARLSKRR